MPIQIAIIDDHPLATQGIERMLEDYPGFKIWGIYATAAALLESMQLQQPDVLLLDIVLPDQPGKALVTIIRQQYPGVKIIALTSIDAPAMVSSMMRKGCSGYLLKNVDRDMLIHAIEEVYSGQEFIEPSLKEKLIANMIHFKDRREKIIPVITRREQQILELIAQEYTTQQIADKLFISFRTVENHRYSLLQKLEVKNSIGLVKVAISLGLIHH